MGTVTPAVVIARHIEVGTGIMMEIVTGMSDIAIEDLMGMVMHPATCTLTRL